MLLQRLFLGAGILCTVSVAGALWILPSRQESTPVPIRTRHRSEEGPEFRQDRSRRVRGSVVDEAGNPIRGASVLLVDVAVSLEHSRRLGDHWPGILRRPEDLIVAVERSMTTDDSGRFQFEDHSTGMKFLCATAAGYQPTHTSRFAVLDGIPQYEQRILLSPETPLFLALSATPTRAKDRSLSVQVFRHVPGNASYSRREVSAIPIVLREAGPEAPVALLFPEGTSGVKAVLLELRPRSIPAKAGESSAVRIPLDGDSVVEVRAGCPRGHACEEKGKPASSCLQLSLVARVLNAGRPAPESGRIRGFVRDAGTGAPVPDVLIQELQNARPLDPLRMIQSAPFALSELGRLARTEVTAADGAFDLDDSEERRLLRVSPPGAPPFWKEVLPKTKAAGDILVGRTGRIAVRSPFRPCEILTLRPSDGTVQVAGVTSDGGELLFNGIPAGRWLLEVQEGFFTYYPRAVIVEAGAQASITLRSDDIRSTSEQLPFIHGFAMGDTGKPLKGSRVVCQAMRGPNVFLGSATCDDEGYYRIKKVPESEELMLAVQPEPGEPRAALQFRKTRIPTSEDGLFCDLSVERPVTEIRVAGPDGKPWKRSVLVQFEEVSEYLMVDRPAVDAEGVLKVRNLRPARYRLQSDDDQGRVHGVSLEILRGVSTYSVSLKSEKP